MRFVISERVMDIWFNLLTSYVFVWKVLCRTKWKTEIRLAISRVKRRKLFSNYRSDTRLATQSEGRTTWTSVSSFSKPKLIHLCSRLVNKLRCCYIAITLLFVVFVSLAVCAVCHVGWLDCDESHAQTQPQKRQMWTHRFQIVWEKMLILVQKTCVQFCNHQTWDRNNISRQSPARIRTRSHRNRFTNSRQIFTCIHKRRL